ncbi:MAG: phosphoesterase [Planctomycetaceae bacterium]|jgi:predicted NUDIX family phosphoesterase|nr:phosphoesterase [Planctomycetaceae bacterium]
MEEHVLVVPTTLFYEIGYFQGFCRDAERYRRVLLAPENVLFRPRSEAEKDPNFKQLIPYMIFCHTGSDGIVRLFQYVRGKGMGESRLHSKRSVGVGGHLSSDDRNELVQNHDLYREGMLRELREEVVIDSEYTEHCVGLINDDESEVGRVHLGIVHCFDLTEPNVTSNEPDLIESGFVPVNEMLCDLSAFESWSSICIEALYGKETQKNKQP